jgi:signal transduction histidine kinase
VDSDRNTAHSGRLASRALTGAQVAELTAAGCARVDDALSAYKGLAQRIATTVHNRRIGATATLVVFLAASLGCSAGIAAESKRVMLLHSFGRDFTPWNEFAKAIRLELERQSPWPVDLHEHSLVTARSSDENPEVPFVEYLRALYAKNRPDLIVSVGAPAAAFVQRHRQQLFPTTPMLLTVVEQRRVRYSFLTENDAVVALWINYFAAIENILRVLPDTKNVTVVVGTSPIEQFWKKAIGEELVPFANRIAVTWTDHLSFDELLKNAAALPPQSAIFWELMIVDAAGVVHEEDKALTRLHAVANAPIFSYTDSFFGRVVGGPHLSELETGRKTAEVAVRILGGEKAGDIKVPPVGFETPKFDWRELQRWGISESRLPPGSEIHFRTATVWEQYRWQIAAIAAVILLQTALILGLMYEHRRRRRAEVEARQRMLELAHMNRHATAGELSASIAHELNQPLGAILHNAETMELILDSPSPKLADIKEIVADIMRDDQRASEVIRRLRRLHTKSVPEAQDIDINETVSEVFEFLSIHATALDVTLSSTLSPQLPLVRGDRIQLQQVILNLVMNGVEAVVGSVNGERKITGRTALLDDASVEISIADSGPGIPSDKLTEVFEPFFTTKEHGMGMGLSIVRTIVEAHAGKIWVENQFGGGAIFRLELPLAKAH